MYLTSSKHINTLILCGFIHKLVQLNNWFSHQRLFKFIGSSLLFVYEGTFSAWTTWLKSNQIKKHCDCSETVEFSKEENLCSKCNLCLNNADITDTCDVCSLSKSLCCNLTNCNLYRVAMIDFSHCFPFDKEDTNYTFGLNKLINYLKELLKLQKDR